jgi:hypothetical protein
MAWCSLAKEVITEKMLVPTWGSLLLTDPEKFIFVSTVIYPNLQK